MMGKETMVAVCRPHWSCFMGRWCLASLFVFTAFCGLAAEGGGWLGPAVLCFAIAGFFAASAWIQRKATYLGMTKTMIVGHTGLIRTKTLATPLAKVQNVGLESGLLGKLLGYGTVTISDAGGGATEFVFKRMANAEAFVEKVQGAI